MINEDKIKEKARKEFESKWNEFYYLKKIEALEKEIETLHKVIEMLEE